MHLKKVFLNEFFKNIFHLGLKIFETKFFNSYFWHILIRKSIEQLRTEKRRGLLKG